MRAAERAAVLEPLARGAVSVDSVAKQYAGIAAVAEVSIDVSPGEFVAVLGPSGCGKSTTLRILAGLEMPDAGTVSLSGRDVTRVPAHQRDVHTVFQSYALFPHLTVADNVAFPLRQRGVPRAEVARRVGEALHLVRLPGVDAQRVTALSGGQQQRVALARALVDRPAVLLLDEPLSAMDRALRQAMQTELRLMQQQLGVTTLLVTHDQEEALSLADRIVVMREGRIEQTGTAVEIYDHPASLFVAEFVGENNAFSGTSDGRGEIDAGSAVLRGGSGAAGPVVALIRPENVRVDAHTAERNSPTVNSIAGVVRAVSVAGSASAVLVACGEQVVHARVARDGRSLPRVGDRVRCSWDAGHVRSFAASEKH